MYGISVPDSMCDAGFLIMRDVGFLKERDTMKAGQSLKGTTYGDEQGRIRQTARLFAAA
jgi:hypothetical protein